MKFKRKKWAGIVLLGILLCSAAVFKGYEVYKLDEQAKTGTPQMESLQEKADTDNFRFQILTRPQFEKGDEEGELMIVNPVGNPYKISVQITLDDTGQEVYASKVLSPGERIRYDKLSAFLEKGAYPATAIFTVLDQETEEAIGTVQAGLEITVNS